MTQRVSESKARQNRIVCDCVFFSGETYIVRFRLVLLLSLNERMGKWEPTQGSTGWPLGADADAGDVTATTPSSHAAVCWCFK